MTAPKIGPRYLIDIADPNGMRCTAMKNHTKEKTPNKPLANNGLTCFPFIGISLLTMYGKINIQVPNARQKTTCNG